jgi:hypothetical protein
MATDGSHGNDPGEAEKAKTQSLFREVNERINDVSTQRASFDMPQDVICECAQPECSELVTMNAVEYRGLRSHSTWFVIAPLEEHFFPEVESIVTRTGTTGSSKSTVELAGSPSSSIQVHAGRSARVKVPTSGASCRARADGEATRMPAHHAMRPGRDASR